MPLPERHGRADLHRRREAWTRDPSRLAVAGVAGAVWAASADEHLVAFDPTSLDIVGRIDVGGRASGVAVASDGTVWVTIK